jgi:L-aspartate oxidase
VSQLGFDMTSEPIPVAPAAHYFLGGVAADTSGRTTLPGLFAAGECAATGVHGANRMAGNSLAEAVVFGQRAAMAMANETHPKTEAPVATSLDMDPVSASVRVINANDWDRLRTTMTTSAGLIRDESSLVEAQKIVDEIASSATAGLRASAIAAGLICRSALARDESRGVHFRSDSPNVKADWDGRHVTLA